MHKNMKRSGFKRKTYEELLAVKKAKKPLKKAKKSKRKTLSKLKELVWEECKRIIREKYEHTCYTCGATGLEGKNLQTGHGKPNGALPLKYKFDLRNLKPQCIVCNLHHGGMTDIFVAKLEKEKDGLDFLMESCVKIDNRWEIKRMELMGSTESWYFVSELLAKYKEI